MLNKYFLTTIVSVMFFSIFAPLGKVEATSEVIVEDVVEEVEEMTAEELDNFIKPYVELKEDGTISFKDNIPQDVYELYNFDQLENHFYTVNQGVRNGTLVVDEELNITDISISLSAVYGKWTYHLWGYDRKFNNAQTKDYVNRLEYQTIAAMFAAGVMPPMSGLASLSGGYWLLLAKRVEANNKGKGVYVAITWVNVFNIKPL
ncbi:hypothetical protein LG307_03160 [Sutcliffiella horikoshii]|uniref:hypothetical protein n=1 Tax=Sutcliffiella horikoshii TaxID=79883 RepID=UPI0038513B90